MEIGIVIVLVVLITALFMAFSVFVAAPSAAATAAAAAADNDDDGDDYAPSQADKLREANDAIDVLSTAMGEKSTELADYTNWASKRDAPIVSKHVQKDRAAAFAAKWADVQAQLTKLSAYISASPVSKANTTSASGSLKEKFADAVAYANDNHLASELKTFLASMQGDELVAVTTAVSTYFIA